MVVSGLTKVSTQLISVIKLCVLVILFVLFMSASAVVGVLLIGVVSWKKIGGVTGDVLGSAEVLCETFSLLGALAFLSLNGNTL